MEKDADKKDEKDEVQSIEVMFIKKHRMEGTLLDRTESTLERLVWRELAEEEKFARCYKRSRLAVYLWIAAVILIRWNNFYFPRTQLFVLFGLRSPQLMRSLDLIANFCISLFIILITCVLAVLLMRGHRWVRYVLPIQGGLNLIASVFYAIKFDLGSLLFANFYRFDLSYLSYSLQGIFALLLPLGIFVAFGLLTSQGMTDYFQRYQELRKMAYRA